jgi:hypothetical protein
MRRLTELGLTIASVLAAAGTATAQCVPPAYQRDRGAGIATSVFGVYVDWGEWVVLPSWGRVRNDGFEYSPEELGVDGERDFLGSLTTTSGTLFVSHGLNDSVALGLQAAVTRATFVPAPEDTSALPDEIRESGLGDVQVEVVWRALRESESRPELYVFTEMLLPHDESKRFIGQNGLAVLPGLGLVRGFRWGTIAARMGIEYDSGSTSELDWGGWSLGYLRRLSDKVRVGAGLDGQVGGANNLDEVWLMGDLQWQVTSRVALRLHNAVGLTEKADGMAPEIGIVVARPRR